MAGGAALIPRRHPRRSAQKPKVETTNLGPQARRVLGAPLCNSPADDEICRQVLQEPRLDPGVTEYKFKIGQQVYFQPKRTGWSQVDAVPGLYQIVRSTGQCNTACSLSAGVWKPKVFRGR